jgi:predicted DCC family thiol-disulfide oxidoreductase YuxK
MRPYALILFDGDCGLCNRVVRFVAARDPAGRFRFAPLQGENGRRECERLGVQVPAGDPDTIVVTTERHAWIRSDAAIEIARRLPWPWRAAFALRVVPEPLRDAAYRWVSRNRFRWFGRADRCAAPTAELRARMLDAAPRPIGSTGGA